MTLDYNEVFSFMKDFGADFLKSSDEIIIDEQTNTYTYIGKCKNIDEVITNVVYAISRPIGKGLEEEDAKRILHKFNKYFKVNLKKNDFRIIYTELCYPNKLDEFSRFIKDGFPIEKIKEKVKYY